MDLSKHMLFQSVRLVGAVEIEPNASGLQPLADTTKLHDQDQTLQGQRNRCSESGRAASSANRLTPVLFQVPVSPSLKRPTQVTAWVCGQQAGK